MSYRHHPNLVNAYDLYAQEQWPLKNLLIDSGGHYWEPARPIAMPNLLERLALAWGVFVGRYDAIVWLGQE